MTQHLASKRADSRLAALPSSYTKGFSLDDPTLWISSDWSIQILSLVAIHLLWFSTWVLHTCGELSRTPLLQRFIPKGSFVAVIQHHSNFRLLPAAAANLRLDPHMRAKDHFQPWLVIGLVSHRAKCRHRHLLGYMANSAPLLTSQSDHRFAS